MQQEYVGHSGGLKKIKLTNDTLVSISDSGDGFFVWKSKGSFTARVRQETYEDIERIETQIEDIDFDDKVHEIDIDKVVDKSISLENKHRLNESVRNENQNRIFSDME